MRTKAEVPTVMMRMRKPLLRNREEGIEDERERDRERERDTARGAAMPLLLVPPFLWKKISTGAYGS